MKKKITIILMISIIISGCNPTDEGINSPQKNNQNNISVQISFDESTHARSESSNRTFDTIISSYNSIDYEFEYTSINDEEEAKNIILKVNNDINKIGELVGERQQGSLKVIIVDKDLMSGSDNTEPYHYDDVLVVNKEFIMNGEYMGALISSLYGIDIPWIYFGLAGAVQEDELEGYESNDEVENLLSNEANQAVLDLFAPRFYGTTNEVSKEQMRMVSADLVQYILVEKGVSYLLDLSSKTRTQEVEGLLMEWLEALNIDISDTLLPLYMTTYTHDLYYDFVLKSPYANYFIKLNDGYCFESINRMVYYLRENSMGIIAVVEFLRTSDLDNGLIEYDVIPNYFIDEASRSDFGAEASTNNIYILNDTATFEYAHIHEYIHTITPLNIDMISIHDYAYFAEGVATYVTSSIDNDISMNDTDFDTMEQTNKQWHESVSLISMNPDEISEISIPEFQMLVNRFSEYYLAQVADPFNSQDFNMEVYTDAYAYALLGVQDVNPDFINMYGLSNSLEYTMYESFFRYLVEKHSLEDAIRVLIDFDSFESIFGCTLMEKMEEWKIYLYSTPI